MNWRQRIDKWLRVSVRRKLLDEHLEEFSSFMKGRVLEVGAGQAGRRGEFKPPFENVGMWLYANLAIEQRPHVLADIQNLPFMTTSFDTLVCMEVLEYVSQPHKAVQVMGRVLKPEGRLILSLPFMHRADTSTDYWRYTEEGISLLLKENGFEILDVRQQGGGLAVAANILKYWIHVAGRRWRLWYGLLLQPVISILWNLDQLASRKLPVMATFSTGYLVLAARNNSKSLIDKEITSGAK